MANLINILCVSILSGFLLLACAVPPVPGEQNSSPDGVTPSEQQVVDVNQDQNSSSEQATDGEVLDYAASLALREDRCPGKGALLDKSTSAKVAEANANGLWYDRLSTNRGSDGEVNGTTGVPLAPFPCSLEGIKKAFTLAFSPKGFENLVNTLDTPPDLESTDKSAELYGAEIDQCTVLTKEMVRESDDLPIGFSETEDGNFRCYFVVQGRDGPIFNKRFIDFYVKGQPYTPPE